MALGTALPDRRRIAALVAVLVFLGLSLGARPARAESWAGVRPVSPEQVAAAVEAAHSARALALVRSNLRKPGRPEPGPVAVAGQGVPAYVLSKDFVLGKAGAAAGGLGYVAVVATTSDGSPTTVKVVPDGPGWRAMGALSGDDERRLSAGLGAGEVLLYEPQINGWYALSDGGVRLLQSSLPQNPVGRFVPLDRYQQQVHGRYADKLPGSDYQRRGGIGFAGDGPRAQAPDETGSVLWWWLG
ncbi:hypothetical protein G3I59_33890, partial [Amycolatopsis rubida]